jgi:hypothetical protein
MKKRIEGKTMRTSVVDFVRKRFKGEGKMHPLDRGLAKQWIKRRLVAVFPELRHDPQALEQTYQALSLEPRAGGAGDAQTYFELTLPEQN